MKRFLSLLLTGALAIPAGAATRPKNIILMIADGMGLAHVTAMRNAHGPDFFQLGRMKTIGLVTTHCADSAVTDSAAAATAFAIGMKTKYRMVGVDAEGVPQKTVLELAHENGKATGLVTTSYFWDATPGAFASHVKSRYEYPEMFRQILASGTDVIVGAGYEKLGKDGLPPIDDVKKSGYEVVTDPSRLRNAAAARVLGIFPTQANDLDQPDVQLPVLAKWAIEKLRTDPDGFFLLVEHEGNDSASHTNNGSDDRAALVSFDIAVGAVLDFAAGRDDTLVIVVGDHETGGLRLSETRDLKKWRMEFSTTDHTATAVPLFAFGPGSEEFAGFMDNTDVGKKLLAFQTK